MATENEPANPDQARRVAALYVQRGGVYWDLPGVDAWDEQRDAHNYRGPWPVVAHPPCQRWGNLAAVNFKRWGGEYNRPGNDGGMFHHALDCVQRFGGVLEHPAFSKAWRAYGLVRPPKAGGWVRQNYPFVTSGGVFFSYTCEVWQSAYEHKARKRTWLYYVGPEPPELDWTQKPGTHQCGGYDQRGKGRNRPTLSRREASATPLPFRDLLLELARGARR